MNKKLISSFLIAGFALVMVCSGCIEGVEEEKVEEPQAPMEERITLTSTVLIISPHPDDGEIFAGGTICYHLSEGSRVIEVFVTSGDAGKDPKGRSGAELARAREGEAKNATAIIGIDELIFLRLPDGKLEYNQTTFDAIKSIVAKYRPYLIYTSEFVDPTYNHSDHINTGRIVHDAVRSLDWDEKPAIRFFDYRYKADASNHYVDITPYLCLRRRALREYRSQTDIILLAQAILPISYLLNGWREDMPGRLCECFREEKYDEESSTGQKVFWQDAGILSIFLAF
jgi:LmbE family N-acetylglucosaminyl deacetylase